MSHSDYYNDFRMQVFHGAMCGGESCRGWILSDVDTWHRCPCGKGPKGHPEYPEQEESETEATRTPVKTQVEDPNDPNYIPF